MATAQRADLGVGERFLEALGRRDYIDIASCFAHDATMRADAIAARFRLWTEEIEDYELVERSVDGFADLLRIRYAARGVDPELGLCMFEQTAYAEVEGGRITKLRLACSGDRPLA